MIEKAVEQMENIVSDKKINRKRPLDDNAQVFSDTNVVSVAENDVLDASVEVDMTLQPSMTGVLQTETETTKSTEIVSLMHKDRSEVDNRLQKRLNIENSSPAHKLPEEGGLYRHDQIITVPSVTILDDQREFGNGDKLDDVHNKVIDLDTGTKNAEASSVSCNNGKCEHDAGYKVENGDKLDDIQNKVIDVNTSTKNVEASSVSGNNGECEHDAGYKVGNGDRLDDIQNKVIDLDTGTKNAEASSVSGNNGDCEHDAGSHLKLCREPLAVLKKKLLVLDINGLLVDIVSPPPWGYKADTYITRRAIFRRPFCLDFMKFCFERFGVGIWSSRTKLNVERVIDYLFEDMKHNLLFCWDSSHCTPSEFYTLENSHKTLVFKELKKLWDKHDPDLPWEKGHYNETNTLLLDDSPYKALLNPPHTAIFPYTYTYRNKFDKSLGTEGALRVYLEGLAEAENVPDYVEQHPFGQRTITENDPSWDFYVKAVGSAPPLYPPE